MHTRPPMHTKPLAGLPRSPEWAAGVRLALPIVFGYGAIGLAFGVVARTSGLSVGEVAAMSLLVYAGSAQFIGANLLVTGATAAVVIGTTFLVNLRHLLLSAALAPSVTELPTARQSALAFGLTDETFVAAAGALEGRPASAPFLGGLFLTSYSAWVAATVLGAVLGNWLGGLRAWGLDFALPAMFIALLVMQLRHRRQVLVAIAAGVLSVLGMLYLPDNYNVLAATILAAGAGAALPARGDAA
ncbi:MAG: AzlC family ABC transporter permease [Symbiobacteriia bacterium]